MYAFSIALVVVVWQERLVAEIADKYGYRLFWFGHNSPPFIAV